MLGLGGASDTRRAATPSCLGQIIAGGWSFLSVHGSSGLRVCVEQHVIRTVCFRVQAAQ